MPQPAAYHIKDILLCSFAGSSVIVSLKKLYCLGKQQLRSHTNKYQLFFCFCFVFYKRLGCF